jgi:MFS family permease
LENPINPKLGKSTILPFAWVILAVVYLSMMVMAWTLFKISPLMPVLMQAFQIDLTRAGYLMSIIAGAGLLLALPSGMLLHRLGPKVILALAMGFMAAGSTAGAISGSFSVLLCSRLLEGVGIGLVGLTAPAIIAMWFPPDRQGIPMGLWATSMPVGSILLFNLAPGLGDSLGWQVVWWIGGGCALIMALVSGVLIISPPSRQQADGSNPRPPVFGEVLSNRTVWLLTLEFTCLNLTLGSLGTYYPTFLNQVRGYPLGQAAFIASVTTMVIIFSAPAAGWLSDRIGSRRLVIALPFLIIGFTFLFPFHVIGWQIYALLIVQGLAIGGTPTATFAAVSEVIPRPQLAGLAIAILLIGQNIGQLVGPILFSELVGKAGWATAGYWMIPFCLVGFISAWMLKVR